MFSTLFTYCGNINHHSGQLKGKSLYYFAQTENVKILQIFPNILLTLAKAVIIHCYQEDEEHSDLVYNTQHEILETPEGEKTIRGTVFVMGKTRPVRLYSNEFKKIL